MVCATPTDKGSNPHTRSLRVAAFNGYMGTMVAATTATMAQWSVAGSAAAASSQQWEPFDVVAPLNITKARHGADAEAAWPTALS